MKFNKTDKEKQVKRKKKTPVKDAYKARFLMLLSAIKRLRLYGERLPYNFDIFWCARLGVSPKSIRRLIRKKTGLKFHKKRDVHKRYLLQSLIKVVRNYKRVPRHFSDFWASRLGVSKRYIQKLMAEIRQDPKTPPDVVKALSDRLKFKRKNFKRKEDEQKEQVLRYYINKKINNNQDLVYPLNFYDIKHHKSLIHCFHNVLKSQSVKFLNFSKNNGRLAMATFKTLEEANEYMEKILKDYPNYQGLIKKVGDEYEVSFVANEAFPNPNEDSLTTLKYGADFVKFPHPETKAPATVLSLIREVSLTHIQNPAVWSLAKRINQAIVDGVLTPEEFCKIWQDWALFKNPTPLKLRELLNEYARKKGIFRGKDGKFYKPSNHPPQPLQGSENHISKIAQEQDERMAKMLGYKNVEEYRMDMSQNREKYLKFKGKSKEGPQLIKDIANEILGITSQEENKPQEVDNPKLSLLREIAQIEDDDERIRRFEEIQDQLTPDEIEIFNQQVEIYKNKRRK